MFSLIACITFLVLNNNTTGITVLLIHISMSLVIFGILKIEGFNQTAGIITMQMVIVRGQNF
jgi:hypothetical protein